MSYPKNRMTTKYWTRFVKLLVFVIVLRTFKCQESDGNNDWMPNKWQDYVNGGQNNNEDNNEDDDYEEGQTPDVRFPKGYLDRYLDRPQGRQNNVSDEEYTSSEMSISTGIPTEETTVSETNQYNDYGNDGTNTNRTDNTASSSVSETEFATKENQSEAETTMKSGQMTPSLSGNGTLSNETEQNITPSQTDEFNTTNTLPSDSEPDFQQTSEKSGDIMTPETPGKLSIQPRPPPIPTESYSTVQTEPSDKKVWWPFVLLIVIFIICLIVGIICCLMTYSSIKKVDKEDEEKQMNDTKPKDNDKRRPSPPKRSPPSDAPPSLMTQKKSDVQTSKKDEKSVKPKEKSVKPEEKSSGSTISSNMGESTLSATSSEEGAVKLKTPSQESKTPSTMSTQESTLSDPGSDDDQTIKLKTPSEEDELDKSPSSSGLPSVTSSPGSSDGEDSTGAPKT